MEREASLVADAILSLLVNRRPQRGSRDLGRRTRSTQSAVRWHLVKSEVLNDAGSLDHASPSVSPCQRSPVGFPRHICVQAVPHQSVLKVDFVFPAIP